MNDASAFEQYVERWRRLVVAQMVAETDRQFYGRAGEAMTRYLRLRPRLATPVGRLP